MDQLLTWFGEQRYHDTLARIRRFWAGEGRVLVSMTSDHAYYRQHFDDDAVVELVIENLRDQARLPGVNLPCYCPDFGTVSTAKYWGGATRFDSTGGHIFIDPTAQTLEEALALTPRPVDDPAMDAARGLRLYRRVCERLETDALWFRTPDLQGVLNTAGLVVQQQELLMAMYSEPALVHAFLDRVCDHLIAYARYLARETGGKLCGSIWPFTVLPIDLGVCFTEDLLPLLSAEMYREFGLPYTRRLAAAFGGAQIHCCGDWGRHAGVLRAADFGLRAVEFHYPFTSIDALAALAPETVFVTYLIPDRQDRYRDSFDYYRRLLAETPHRYWFPLTTESPEGWAFLAEVEACCSP